MSANIAFRNADIGMKVLELAGKSQSRLVLIAPFIKAAVMKKILGMVTEKVEIFCMTRWRADEIAAGVSDLEVYEIINSRAGKLYLLSNLHAKYYRGDELVLLGSSNLTQAALGWSNHSNQELMMQTELNHELSSFEQAIFSKAVLVDDEAYRMCQERMTDYLDSIPEPIRGKSDIFEMHDEIQKGSGEEWMPQSRYPDSLFLAYSGLQENLSSFALGAAVADLQHFDIPNGLNEKSFRAFIGMQLLQEPIIKKVDDAVLSEYRFGEMVQKLRQYVHDPSADMKALWQVLIRWLLYFLPERYVLKTYNYSEILERRC